MLFNTVEFGLFFLIVFGLYLLTYKFRRIQNVLILVASYFFYGWWDWRFLFLIAISSISDYIIGIQLEKTDSKVLRRNLLTLSLVINLGMLGFFKYFNFFIDSFISLFNTLGFHLQPVTLSIILPVGISFYTFQTLSYTIDIYKKKITATSDFFEFFAFVSFFPQLIAGPIERASHLLPQFKRQRSFNVYETKEGVKQFFWGLFKKIVIADNCAHFANVIFENYENLPGSVLVLGALFFAFQIYGDFSGYSDMAIGLARIMGFDLMQNFKSPYLADNIQDFWRRWHISLSTWFRDYVYIPLGGNRVKNEWRLHLNIAITFIVSGFWHGANWTFVIWGAIHSLVFILTSISKKRGYSFFKEGAYKTLSRLFTFSVVTLAWIFFRSETVTDAVQYLARIMSISIFTNPFEIVRRMGIYDTQLLFSVIFILLTLALELRNRNDSYTLHFKNARAAVKYSVYLTLLMAVILFRNTTGAIEFIYFQF